MRRSGTLKKGEYAAVRCVTGDDGITLVEVSEALDSVIHPLAFNYI